MYAASLALKTVDVQSVVQVRKYRVMHGPAMQINPKSGDDLTCTGGGLSRVGDFAVTKTHSMPFGIAIVSNTESVTVFGDRNRYFAEKGSASWDF